MRNTGAAASLRDFSCQIQHDAIFVLFNACNHIVKLYVLDKHILQKCEGKSCCSELELQIDRESG